MKPNVNPILVGIVAGLAAAVFWLGAIYVPLALLLAPIIILTFIFIAAMGFGTVAGLVAVATTSIIIGVFVSSIASGLVILVQLLPAMVMAYAANLARPATEIGGPDKALAWFPLSDVLLLGAVCAALISILISAIAFQDVDYAESADVWAKMMAQIQPNVVITPEMRASVIEFMKGFIPPFVAGFFTLTQFTAFYFANRILNAFGRNTRPREDIRTSLRMNRLAIAVFFAGVALAFIGGPIALVGSCFTGAVAGGFLLSGFAIIHNAVRGKSWALPTLIILYLVTLIFPPVTIFIAIAGGLANPRRAIALTPTKPDPDQNNSN